MGLVESDPGPRFARNPKSQISDLGFTILIFAIWDAAERLGHPASPLNRYEVAHLLRNPVEWSVRLQGAGCSKRFRV